MLPTVYFESEERTLHGRQLNPNNIGLKLGACSSEYFPSVLKCPLEEGMGRGGEKRIVLSSALCLAWLSRAIAALIWYGLGLLSHTLSTWVFCMQAVSAGVLVLLFLTAGSAPLGPHVKLCGNSGGGWKSPIKHTKSVGGETGSVSGEIPAEWFNLLGRPGWGHRGSLLP